MAEVDVGEVDEEMSISAVLLLRGRCVVLLLP